jgi:hypothetical protein
MGQMTVGELERQREHEAAVAKLKVERAQVATRLAAIEQQLAQVGDADFAARLGSTPVASMTLREKAETVNRLGYAGFRDLLTGRK